MLWGFCKREVCLINIGMLKNKKLFISRDKRSFGVCSMSVIRDEVINSCFYPTANKEGLCFLRLSYMYVCILFVNSYVYF